jgi:hypothetical protein
MNRHRRRSWARAASLLLLACAAVPSASAWEPPVEPPRVTQSYLTALYAPSFGLALGQTSPSAYPLDDYFAVDGGLVNLFPKGDNLNFYFGIGHSIAQLPLFAGSAPATESFATIAQARDILYGRSTYVFLDYFQLNSGVEYDQNRKVARESGYEDYDYDRLSLSETLSLDLRYSSIESYYKGKIFLYPEQGLRASAGLLENRYYPAGDSAATGSPSWSPQAFGEMQYLIHPQRLWVIALDATGKANLEASSPRVQAATSSVLGAVQTAGDYALDANVELRFLRPNGLFWESPEFWYVSSFLFKFMPGFILGYDAGAAGLYRDGSVVFQQSLYVSPLVAIRMNGDLEAVLRADISAATSSQYKVLLTLSVGTVGAGKTSPMLQQGIQ